ncbi:MAG TPA: hypothetical protein VM008_05565 [Phycisphaerae bacterium]|nr:hypothetical protein [Phycisphaerae bacterium]
MAVVAFVFLCLLFGCAGSEPVYRHPLPVAAPHLYFYKPSELAGRVRRDRPDVRDGFLERDSKHDSLVFGEFDYGGPHRAFAFRNGSYTEVPANELPYEVARRAPALADPDERIVGADDSCSLFFYYAAAAHVVRIRQRNEPSTIVFELHSEIPPERLFSVSDRLYLVTGVPRQTRLGPVAVPGTKPDSPRHVFVLRRSGSAITLEREVLVPGSDILDVDPWSDNVLAEESVWVGWTPLFYGQDVWQMNRFVYELSTGRRTEVPIASGIGMEGLPDGFFLRADAVSRGR